MKMSAAYRFWADISDGMFSTAISFRCSGRFWRSALPFVLRRDWASG
jgi:hypothetical protein